MDRSSREETFRQQDKRLNIGVPKEIVAGERRVAMVPETVAKVAKLGYTVQIQSGAGEEAGFADDTYKAEGAEIVTDASALYGAADILLKVQPPTTHTTGGKHELEMMKSGGVLVSFFYSLINPDLVKKAAETKVDVISMDAVPRITKAQRMDALSSQTNLAGYKTVLLAANALDKIFPLMMTAAGTIAPAKVVIMGAGVAGLQAIATAKRLGAVVEVSDVRPAVKEQVESLGAKYIEPPVEEGLEGEGGYAREATPEFLAKQQEILEKHVAEADVVITTALVPGKKAPVLVTEAMVKKMRSGAVIVDMATEQGGNCELSEMNSTVVKEGVTIIGLTNLPSHMPMNASELYSRNIHSLLQYLTKEGKLELDPEDEIVTGALITRGGEIAQEKTREAMNQG